MNKMTIICFTDKYDAYLYTFHITSGNTIIDAIEYLFEKEVDEVTVICDDAPIALLVQTTALLMQWAVLEPVKEITFMLNGEVIF